MLTTLVIADIILYTSTIIIIAIAIVIITTYYCISLPSITYHYHYHSWSWLWSLFCFSLLSLTVMCYMWWLARLEALGLNGILVYDFFYGWQCMIEDIGSENRPPLISVFYHFFSLHFEVSMSGSHLNSKRSPASASSLGDLQDMLNAARGKDVCQSWGSFTVGWRCLIFD